MSRPVNGSAKRIAWSLRRRLLAWLLIATVLIGAIALADTWREANNTADLASDRVLAGSALAIAERVIVGENGSLEVDIPYVALEMLTSAAQDRVFYRVDGPGGRFLTGYQSLPSMEEIQDDMPVYADAAFRGEAIRLVVIRRFASTGIRSIPFSVTVAETTVARSRLARALVLRSALRLGVMILGAAVIVWIAVTISLRPLDRLGEDISKRSPDDLRPITRSVPVEVENLVETVNSFMVRLQSALDALRHFTGNASHQLRTPLAIIRTQLALSARASTLEAAQEAARLGDQSVAHAEHVLARLLRMANIDAAGSGERENLARVELVSFARGIAADRVPPAAAAGIDLGFEGEGEIHILAEPLLLAELLGNLIDNAIAYAGKGAEVTVRVARREDGVDLAVEDNGPGIAPEKRAVMRQRFARGEENAVPGAGLGLAIVEEIAGLFDARLFLEDGRDGRGLTARIAFAQADRFPV